MEKYDWAAMQVAYNNGASFRNLTELFGVPNETINKARRGGLFVSRTKKQAADIAETKRNRPPKKTYQHVKAWRQNVRRKLVEGFGSVCAVCAVKDHPIIYDLHHIDPTKKEFGLASKIMSWDNLKVEAQKCVLLCSPCHRKVHADLAEVPNDYQRFDESLIRI